VGGLRGARWFRRLHLDTVLVYQMHGRLGLLVYDRSFGVSTFIPLGQLMRILIASRKSQAGFGTPLSVVCAFFICLCLIAIGLYLGRGALLYILAGMLIGGIVGMFLSYLWHHVLKSHPQLAKKLRYRRIRADEPKECESDAGQEQKRPLTPAGLEARAAKQREFDEMIAHIHELKKDPQAYDNYEREIKNTTKLRTEYGDTTQVRKDRIRTQVSLIEDIWQNCFKLNPYFSFIHDRSRIAAWESFAGGKSALIAAIKKRYGANIADVYDEALPVVLNEIASTRKTLG